MTDPVGGGGRAVAICVGLLQNHDERLPPPHMPADPRRALLALVRDSSVCVGGGNSGRAEGVASDSLRRSPWGWYPAPENGERQQSGIDGDAVEAFASFTAESPSVVKIPPPPSSSGL